MSAKVMPNCHNSEHDNFLQLGALEYDGVFHCFACNGLFPELSILSNHVCLNLSDKSNLSPTCRVCCRTFCESYECLRHLLTCHAPSTQIALSDCRSFVSVVDRRLATCLLSGCCGSDSVMLVKEELMGQIFSKSAAMSDCLKSDVGKPDKPNFPIRPNIGLVCPVCHCIIRIHRLASHLSKHGVWRRFTSEKSVDDLSTRRLVVGNVTRRIRTSDNKSINCETAEWKDLLKVVGENAIELCAFQDSQSPGDSGSVEKAKTFDENACLDPFVIEPVAISKPCAYCDVNFIQTNSITDIASHKRDEHQLNYVFPCYQALCSLMFTQLEEAILHWIDHKQPPLYICKSCNEHFRSYNSLIRHHKYLGHSSDARKTQQFVASKERHCLQMFLCSSCDKKFTRNENLTRHFRLMHTKIGARHTCQVCKKWFKRRDKLKDHERVHHADLQFTCPLAGCQLSFASKSGRDYHAKTHSYPSKFQCNLCHESFTHISRFRQHMQNFHHNRRVTASASYPCPHCSRFFSRPERVKRHLCSDHGIEAEWPFKCDRCSKGFSGKKSLQTHLARQHPNRAPQSVGSLPVPALSTPLSSQLLSHPFALLLNKSCRTTLDNSPTRSASELAIQTGALTGLGNFSALPPNDVTLQTNDQLHFQQPKPIVTSYIVLNSTVSEASPMKPPQCILTSPDSPDSLQSPADETKSIASFSRLNSINSTSKPMKVQSSRLVESQIKVTAKNIAYGGSSVAPSKMRRKEKVSNTVQDDILPSEFLNKETSVDKVSFPFRSTTISDVPSSVPNLFNRVEEVTDSSDVHRYELHSDGTSLKLNDCSSTHSARVITSEPKVAKSQIRKIYPKLSYLLSGKQNYCKHDKYRCD